MSNKPCRPINMVLFWKLRFPTDYEGILMLDWNQNSVSIIYWKLHLLKEAVWLLTVSNLKVARYPRHDAVSREPFHRKIRSMNYRTHLWHSGGHRQNLFKCERSQWTNGQPSCMSKMSHYFQSRAVELKRILHCVTVRSHCTVQMQSLDFGDSKVCERE